MIKWKNDTGHGSRANSDKVPSGKYRFSDGADPAINSALLILFIAAAVLSISILTGQFEIIPAYGYIYSGSTYTSATYGGSGSSNSIPFTTSTSTAVGNSFARSISENLGVFTSAGNGPSPPSNSYVRSLSESVIVGTSTGNGGTPSVAGGNSYARSLSESVAFSTSTGNQPPRSFARGISDGISITTSNQQPSSPVRAAIIGEAGTGPTNVFGQQSTSGSSRIDERSSRSIMNGRGDYLQRNSFKSIRPNSEISVTFQSEADVSSCMNHAGGLGNTSCGDGAQDSETDSSGSYNNLLQSTIDGYALEVCRDAITTSTIAEITSIGQCALEAFWIQENGGIATQQTAFLAIIIPAGYVAASAIGSRRKGSGIRTMGLSKIATADDIITLRQLVLLRHNPITIKVWPNVRALLVVVLIIIALPLNYYLPPAFASITFVNAGTSSATNGASAPTPGLPASLQTNDLMITYFYSRESVDGTVSISSGWTQVYNDRTSGGLVGVWYRLYQSGDTAPTFTLGNHGGTDTAIAQIAAWRGVDTSDPIDATGTLSTNGAQANIGAISGITLELDDTVIAVGGKLDDWTSVATLSGDSLTWSEIGETPSTLGADAGLVWDYAINVASQTTVTSKTFTVTGGTSVTGKGVMFSINVRHSANISNTLTTTDSLARMASLHSSTSDALSTTDSISRNMAAARSISETVTITVSVVTTTSRSVTESLTPTDSISINVARSIPNSLTIADTITTNINFALSQTVTVIDSISSATARSAGIDDTIVVVDSISTSLNTQRTITDAIAAADAINYLITRAISDTVNTSDSLTVARTRAMEETITFADSVSINVIRSISDSITTSESMALSFSFSRPISDSISFSDGLTMDVERTLEDEVTFTDTVAAIGSLARATGDSVTINDSITLRIGKDITDSLEIAENLNSNAGYKRSLSESIGAADALSTFTYAARPVSDSITLEDLVNVRITRTLDEGVALTDSLSTSVSTTRPVSESLALSETISVIVYRGISESFTIDDAVSSDLGASRSLDESLAIVDSGILVELGKFPDDDVTLSDSLAATVTSFRALADEFELTDAVAVLSNAARVESEEVNVTDMITTSLGASRTTADSISVTDTVAAAALFSRLADEDVSLSDQVSSLSSLARSIPEETMTIADSISVNVLVSGSNSIAITDQLQVNYSAFRAISTDEINIADTIDAVFSRSLSEPLTIDDSIAKSISTTRSISNDELAISDSLSSTLNLSRSLAESLSVSDSLTFQQESGGGMADTLTIDDSLEVISPNKVEVADSIALTDSFTDLSIHIQLILEEALQLASSEANPIEAHFTLPLGEGLLMGDGFGRSSIDIPVSLEESLQSQDSLSSSFVSPSATSVSVSETLATSDAITLHLSLLPPSPPSSNTVQGPMPRITIVSTTSGSAIDINPLPATLVTGNYTSSSGVSAIVQQIGLDNYEIRGLSGGIGDDTTMVSIPTFMLDMIPTSEMPSTTGFLTAPISEMPADANIVIPIDVTQSREENGEQPLPLRSLTVRFSPQTASQNFTMLISMLDERPGSSDAILGGEAALYLDFRWTGDFNGSTPSMSAYYSEKPTLTFTISDEWAVENNLKRDGNGVPMLDLYLLDEDTGSWSKLSDSIMRPDGVDANSENGDDTFTYTASLEHFSTYAISGSKSSSGGGGGGASSGGQAVKYSVFLTEDAAIAQDSVSEAVVVGSHENPSGTKTFTVQIYNQLMVSAKPIPYGNDKYGDAEYASVDIAIQDIRTDYNSLSSASAGILFQVTYHGSDGDLASVSNIMVLHYWYLDESGMKVFDASTPIKLESMKASKVNVMVPFGNPGRYHLFAEVYPTTANDSAQGHEEGITAIGSASTEIEVSWIAVNLYLVLIIAFVILVSSVVTWAFAFRTRKMPRPSSSIGGESASE